MNNQTGTSSDMRMDTTRKLKLLSIKLADAEYAFPLQEIRRIIPADGIEHDPIAPGFVHGAMTVGEDRLAVIDLRARLGLGEAKYESGSGHSVVVAEINNIPVGFLIDAVGSLYDISSDELQESRWVDDLAGLHKQGIGFLEIGDHAMEAISFQGVLNASELTSIDNWRGSEDAVLRIALREDRAKRLAERDTQARNPLRELAGSYLVVRAGRQLLGIRTSQISEVLPCNTLVDIPLTNDEFSGVLLLRGTTYPVIDLRLRLGLPEDEDGISRPGIVLVKDGQGFSGMFVQQIVQLSEIEVRQIQSAEDDQASIHRHLIAANANLSVGCATLINIPELLLENKPSLSEGYRQFQQHAHEQGCKMQSGNLKAA